MPRLAVYGATWMHSGMHRQREEERLQYERKREEERRRRGDVSRLSCGGIG